jgi:hypothetical protein
VTVDYINAAGFTLFVVGLTACVVSVGFRMIQFARAGIPQPRLIWRDVAVFGLLTLDFLIVLAHRVAGLPFAREVWFSLLTVGLALAAVAIWLHYELAIIGHHRDRR